MAIKAIMAAAILTGEMAQRHHFDPGPRRPLARVHLCTKMKPAYDCFHWAALAALRPLRVTGWQEQTNARPTPNEMKYRDFEYTVVQDLGRQRWKWSVSVADVVIMGQAATKSEAVAEAERAIDRALSRKKLRLLPREDRD